MQGAKALPRIQPAHGWERVEGRGPPPIVVLEPRKVPGIQTAQGWSGSRGRNAPCRGAGNRNPCRTQTLVCISAPFGLSVHTIAGGIGVRKMEMRLSLY